MADLAERLENDGGKAGLLAAARAVIARDGGNLTIRAVCAEAGIGRPEFNRHFTGKLALMAALLAVPEQAPPLPPRPADTATPVAEPAPTAPPDAWLERRLRVFERAVTQLEAKAEAASRDHARAIALLEERLERFQENCAAVFRSEPRQDNGLEHDRDPTTRDDVPAGAQAAPAITATSEPVSAPTPAARGWQTAPAACPEPDADELPEDDSADDGPFARMTPESVAVGPVTETAPAEPAEAAIPEIEVAPETGMALLLPEAPRETVSREDMAEVLASARQAARNAAEEDIHPGKGAGIRLRWIAAGAVCLVAVFASIGLVVGGGARATVQKGSGVEHRQLAAAPFSRLVARADAGDVKAESRLALAYVRGQGVTADPRAALRWAGEAARHGEPVAQYLLGTMYQQAHEKNGIKPDPARAFHLFSASASQGNIKAMHNLAIAYAEGIGTAKDEALAAQWFERAASHGYVDSAFDLAVLYERGEGVKQSLKDALRWYSIAALAGDRSSADRAAFLRHQVSPQDAVLASNAAASFAPLAPIQAANTL
jgi:TPR repeat protein